MNDQQQSRADGLNEEQREALEWAADRAHVASLGKPVVGIESRRHRALRNLLDALAEVIPEGCTPADARMLREANHALAAENDALRCALRPFARVVSTDKLSWAMVEYCVRGDPEKQTFQAPQMQRAFNRAADILRAESSQPAAPPIVSAPASDARECLMDVVSHHHDFVTACKSIKGELHACGAHDSAAYWQKQIDVLDRMKAQAERALATSANETGAEGAQKEAVMLLLQARDELCLIEWEGEDPPERIHTLFDKIEAFVTRSPAMAAEAVAIPDEATFQRLFIKHGGPVESEGWCINESGLRDFLSDLAAFPQPMTIPAGWMFVPKHRGTKPLAELIIAASLACVENRLLDDDDRHELAQFADQLQHTPQPAQADARVWLTATVIQKCIDSCAAEYLEDVTGHPEDAAYCQGITDCIDALNRLKTADWSAILAAHPGQPEPIDMLLFCPKCGAQHVDAPEKASDDRPVLYADAWTNPPHRSHLCHACGTVWRPADVPTNGVAAIQTSGKADTWSGQPVPRAEVTDAVRDVLDERHRQIDAEGWTPAHDDEHDKCEMALAAIVYTESAVGYHPSCPDTWPWSPKWFKPTTPRRDLVKAGALILAELERLDRAALLNGADHDQ
ncbi:Uncharacterised protein [Burkholderia pseudomallei]|nr:Uncharacterised protein [Burkholderia pseudomallei]